MTNQEVSAIATAFSQAWGMLFNTQVYVHRFTGASAGNTVNQVYNEVKQKTWEEYGPFNASVMYQPTLQELNEMGLLEPANAMITFVNQDLQQATGSKGTVGYGQVTTQDRVIIPWGATTKELRLAEFTYQTQFADQFIFLNVGCVELLK